MFKHFKTKIEFNEVSLETGRSTFSRCWASGRFVSPWGTGRRPVRVSACGRLRHLLRKSLYHMSTDLHKQKYAEVSQKTSDMSRIERTLKQFRELITIWKTANTKRTETTACTIKCKENT